MSARIHPDKLRGVEEPRLAFEEVRYSCPLLHCFSKYRVCGGLVLKLKDAYLKLCDKDQRETIIMNIEHIRNEVRKDRKRLISKGVSE